MCPFPLALPVANSTFWSNSMSTFIQFLISGPTSTPTSTSTYYAVKKVFVENFANVFEVFTWFFNVFASFSKFSDVFRPIRIHSDLLGRIRMHSEAFGSVWTFPKNFGFFGIFELVFDGFGRNFTKNFFHGSILCRMIRAPERSHHPTKFNVGWCDSIILHL